MKGLSTVLDSNKSGWLQTFLSYITIFMSPKKSCYCIDFLVVSLWINSSYKYFCRRDKGHFIIYSVFVGSYFSTSRFSRLRRKGLRIECSFFKISLLTGKFFWRACYIGRENHSMKSECESKILGIRKCSRLHSSPTSF